MTTVHDSFLSTLKAEQGNPVTVNVTQNIEEWCAENADGFYIRDLDFICQIIEILAHYLTTDFSHMRPAFNSFLDICAKPLMELKANERLSAKGLEKIENYMAKLSNLWSVCDPASKIKLGWCFRCIVNGGTDPTLLKCEIQEYIPDGQRLKVTDTSFVHKIIRDSGCINVLANEYLTASYLLNYPMSDETDPTFAPTVAQNAVSSTDLGASIHDGVDYGLPKIASAEEVNVAAAASDFQQGLEIADNDNEGPVSGSGAPSPQSQSSALRGNMSPSGGSVGSQQSLRDVALSPAVSRELSDVMLRLMLDLSGDNENAAILATLGVCDGAVMMIQKDSDFNPNDPRISYDVELMWNVLEQFLDKVKAANTSPVDIRHALSLVYGVMDFEMALNVLYTVLNYLLLNGFRLLDKECRNEVVIVLTMIAEFPQSTPSFIQSGMLNLLVTYACYEEMGKQSWFFFSKPVANSRNFGTYADCDLEFKRELLFLITEVLRSDDPEVLLLVGSSPMLSCMLAYCEQDSLDHKKHQPLHTGAAPGNQSHHDHTIGGGQDLNASMNSYSYAEEKGMGGGASSPQQQSFVGNNSIAQSASGSGSTTNAHGNSKKKAGFIANMPNSKLRGFQLLTMSFLVHSAPKLLGEFERLNGIARAVNLLAMYGRSQVVEHKQFVFSNLIMLNRCLNNSLTVRQFLEDNNCMQTFLFIYDNNDDEETRAQSVRIISTLCSGNNLTCQRQLRAQGGTAGLIAPIMKYVSTRAPAVGTKAGVKIDAAISTDAAAALQDPLDNPLGGEISILVIAIMDCFSNAILGNEFNESSFADQDGMDCLLELLEVSPFVLRIKILRVLSDLLMNRNLVVYTNAWRSPKTLRSAAQLFCHCWLDEEARLNCERKERGLICDIWNPLGNHVWPVDTSVPPAIPRGSSTSIGGASSSVSDAVGFTGVVGQTLNTFSATSAGITQSNADLLPTMNRSFTAMKLATAILASRNAASSNLPVDICEKALDRDSRVVIASILRLLGVYELYGISDPKNPLKQVAEGLEGGIVFSESKVRDHNSQVLAQGSYIQASPSNSPGNPAINSSGRGSPTQQGFAASSSQVVGGGGVEGEQQPSHGGAGGAGDLGVTHIEKQVLSMAHKYSALREGEWWQAVRVALENMSASSGGGSGGVLQDGGVDSGVDGSRIEGNGGGVNPIESDLALLDACLEMYFDASQAVQLEQMDFYDEGERQKKNSEDQFVDQILTKKQQQIKAEWLKKYGKGKGGTASKAQKSPMSS